eukprot:CAMPEP_0197823178 /NCGR_PEP_ID=MMETSP1437-20131217/495_1 /TAXON_ID=49252 ORGANISM="Eucampia antarctica, Strain CCMP1452" /NCGR_SAMPLE_ID=MMETSP1437 /ASSEMBLY_ACC=CAM_ASM_001096 /LENGTH=347 /DNA_ID=CAMNT_0043422195 /DNA_START=85 /DNA_END=1128 /DNA_ORIENTATION=+
MKVVLVSKFGQPDDVMSVVEGVTKKPAPSKKELLIRVMACSLSPGDYRALLGDKRVVANPTMPYIPGGDVSGIVEDVPEILKNQYDIGDRVVSTWDTFGIGGLAEYKLVNPKNTAKLPKELTFQQGAALVNSAPHAKLILDRAQIKKGDRVLVLGGSGGVGTTVIQVARLRGASYVAAVSTDDVLMRELGVDKTIDYRKENWYDVKEWQDTKFDVIIDLAVGKKAWSQCKPILKGCRASGRFVAVVHENWHINCRHLYHIFGILCPPLFRQLFNLFRTTTPYYRMYLNEPSKTSIETMLSNAANEDFKTILDPKSPHPFTTQGVREAWNHHIAKRGHGKIVINVCEQ